MSRMTRAIYALLFATLAGGQSLQPFELHVQQLERALDFMGQPLPAADLNAIAKAAKETDEKQAIAEIERILDKHALCIVEINGESRVKVEAGAARPELVQGGTRLFLVKVLNNAQVTAPVRVLSAESGNVYIPSKNDPKPAIQLTPSDAAARWADISEYNKPPMNARLLGIPVEYRILQIYSRDAGQRAAKISFDIGQGTQDIGFRNDLLIAFHVVPARKVTLRVRDEHGQPTIASFVVKDRQQRLYPNPSKRLAPDFFFQPQVYRADGESLDLPDGYYTMTVGAGPEYHPHTKEFAVASDSAKEVSFQLDRWIDPSKYGWYSSDHHVHAAGCSHYQNPTEGVLPKDMARQLQGEKLNIGTVLTWGPDYYYQKQFFSGHDDPLTTASCMMHYDLEVSGFPSSHAGHLVLLGLHQQDYPGTKRIEDWPTWDYPILKWGKSQGATVGFAHSGWGLEVSGTTLPTFQVPGFDGIGANEFVADVTDPATVDFISAGDTPAIWELNIWYHVLNSGFRTRISGETDFPCIYDGRVGQARGYARIDGPVTYAKWLETIRAGRMYVSDGRSHLMDFAVNGLDVGTADSEVKLAQPGKINVKVKAAAYLDATPNEHFRNLAWDKKPYWDLERARIGSGREVPVELIVNGKPVERQTLLADGTVRDLRFETQITQSSWVALRILPSSHTNPIFVLVGEKPVRASRKSAAWCRAAVQQCWTQKERQMSSSDRAAAKKLYDRAAETYRKIEAESTVE